MACRETADAPNKEGEVRWAWELDPFRIPQHSEPPPLPSPPLPSPALPSPPLPSLPSPLPSTQKMQKSRKPRSWNREAEAKTFLELHGLGALSPLI